MMTTALHPENALEDTLKSRDFLPACEHIAGNKKFIDKAFKLYSDLSTPFDLTIDLEDGAPQGKEQAQRDLAVESIGIAPAGLSVGVRVHPFSNPHFDDDVKDVLKNCSTKIAYLTIPKTESRQQLIDCISKINSISSKDRKIPLHILIETPTAVEEVWEIAQLEQVATLDFGSMDLISSYYGSVPEECMMSPGQFEHAIMRRAKEKLCAAALAFGKTPSHNVCVNFKNEQEVFNDASRAYREFGFLRMWSIHPSQIEQINAAMTPNANELEMATKVLLLGMSSDWGPINVDNRLHDRASYRYYWSILKRAKLLGAELPNDANSHFFNESVAN